MKMNYFNFREFRGGYLLTNDLGRYVFLDKGEFRDFISGKISMESEAGKRLAAASMAYEDSDLRFSEISHTRLRNAKSHLAIATSLHIFVVTTACNMSCIYCQANSGNTEPNLMMSPETAEKSVDIALQSPEKHLSFEFQGGEPLLNFRVIRHIVEYTEKNKSTHVIEYNVVTNLTLITDEMLSFFEKYHINISTSLDGASEIHDMNRPFKDGTGTYEKVKEGIEKVRKKNLHIGAIETTTRYSLHHTKELIGTYKEMGFDSIFVRHLTQLGKAGKYWDRVGYTAPEFIAFYEEIIDEMIELNKKGTIIREQHASILLKRIMGNRVNYMELRSPCGGGIGQLAYFSDGRVFSCDEGRMLAEMGYDAFRLGDVYKDTYQSIMENRSCRAVCAASTLESIPSCCDCVYQPYCGVCPVISYATDGDIIEKSPNSFRCRIYKGMLDCLFGRLTENNKETVDVLKAWSE